MRAAAANITVAYTAYEAAVEARTRSAGAALRRVEGVVWWRFPAPILVLGHGWVGLIGLHRAAGSVIVRSAQRPPPKLRNECSLWSALPRRPGTGSPSRHKLVRWEQPLHSRAGTQPRKLR